MKEPVFIYTTEANHFRGVYASKAAFVKRKVAEEPSAKKCNINIWEGMVSVLWIFDQQDINGETIVREERGFFDKTMVLDTPAEEVIAKF